MKYDLTKSTAVLFSIMLKTYFQCIGEHMAICGTQYVYVKHVHVDRRLLYSFHHYNEGVCGLWWHSTGEAAQIAKVMLRVFWDTSNGHMVIIHVVSYVKWAGDKLVWSEREVELGGMDNYLVN